MESIRECSEKDCNRRHYARGWCSRCYQRYWAKGEIDRQPRTLVAPGASLEDRLRHTGWTVTERGCWEWNGSRNKYGYGQVAVGEHNGKAWMPRQTHRVSYEVFKGDPTGIVVRHTCDNPPCMNPAHLIPGSSADNADDMRKRKRNPTGDYRSDKVLTDLQVSQIRDRYAAGGVNQLALAAEYGCSQQLVSLIVRGKRRFVESRPGARAA